MLARISCRLNRSAAAPWRRWYHPCHEEIRPLEIRWDREKEVPWLCNVRRMDHVSELYIPNPRYLLHTYIDRYIVHNVLKEIYVHIKKRSKNKLKSFDTGDWPAAVKVLEKFGSLYMYRVGTCVKAYDHDRISVVIDKGLWKIIDKNIAEYTPPSMAESSQGFSMQWVKPTGYVMWSVPWPMLIHDAFRVRKGVMDFCHPKLRRELLREGMSLEKADEIVDSLGFKAAVEIERSVINQGNLVFFMEAKAAGDINKVMLELEKHTGIDTGIYTLVPHPTYENPSNVFCFRLQDNRSTGWDDWRHPIRGASKMF